MMVSRLIFRPHGRIRRDDGENKIEHVIGFVSLLLECLSGKSDRGRKARSRAMKLPQGSIRSKSPPRKVSKVYTYMNVPKPTQVGRLRTPRRTGEYWLRNSAKKRPYLRYKACHAYSMAAAKESLATVYQKHNSVLSRKALYTG